MLTNYDYQNSDILLMDPCFSREIGEDEEMELDCSDLVLYSYADGWYHVIKGRHKDMVDIIENDDFDPKPYSIGVIDVETARIGVYDYHRAIEEKPELEARIQNKEIAAAIIRDFTGTIRFEKDEYDDYYLVGESSDGSQDFFTIIPWG